MADDIGYGVKRDERDEKSGETGKDDRGKESWQEAASSKRSEIRRQRSGVNLISDLRLLTSVIDDSYDFNDFYDFYGFYDFYDLTI